LIYQRFQEISMETTQEPEQVAPTRAQKDGRACIDCGSTHGPFTAAGYVYTRSVDGGRLPWAVVACPEHTVAAA
jgi:hypothetical protein